MPTDNAAVYEIVRAISESMPNLTSAENPLSNTKRKEIVWNAERLAIAAREPEENLYFQATQV